MTSTIRIVLLLGSIAAITACGSEVSPVVTTAGPESAAVHADAASGSAVSASYFTIGANGAIETVGNPSCDGIDEAAMSFSTSVQSASGANCWFCAGICPANLFRKEKRYGYVRPYGCESVAWTGDCC